MIIPNIWVNKNVPNHQPDKIWIEMGRILLNLYLSLFFGLVQMLANVYCCNSQCVSTLLFVCLAMFDHPIPEQLIHPSNYTCLLCLHYKHSKTINKTTLLSPQKAPVGPIDWSHWLHPRF